MDKETIKILLGGGGLLAIGAFIKEIIQLIKPKNKIDVEKIQSEIRLNEAEIRVNDAEIKEKSDEQELKMSTIGLTLSADLTARLQKAYEVQDKIRVELDRARLALADCRAQGQKSLFEYEETVDSLKKQLRMKGEEIEALNKLKKL